MYDQYDNDSQNQAYGGEGSRRGRGRRLSYGNQGSEYERRQEERRDERFKGLRNENTINGEQQNFGQYEYYEPLPRLRIDFPKFNGKKALDWVYKAEQYFTCQRVPMEQRVALSVIHFDEEAMHWYRCMKH